MVATIRRIDTATAYSAMRTFVTHNNASPKSVPFVRAVSYDMMNTTEVSGVMRSLQNASISAHRQADETMRSYRARSSLAAQSISPASVPTSNTSTSATTGAQVAQTSPTTTTARLTRLNHSSVSQDFSALLQYHHTFSAPVKAVKNGDVEGIGRPATTQRGQEWELLRRQLQGPVEVGARELARVGIFGDRTASRRIELAL